MPPLRIPPPRALPLTILALTALLGVKSVALVRAATSSGMHPGNVQASVLDTARAAEAVAHPAPHPDPAIHLAAASTPAAPAAAKPGSVKCSETRPPNADAGAAEPPVTDSERALLQDLRRRRSELDARERAISTREAVLSAAEKKLSSRVQELTALQQRLEAHNAARKQREEENWVGLVKTYEDMKPRDAAAIFNALDPHVLLQVLDRMKDRKAAAVLAAMDPERARVITAQLAQMRLHENALPPAPAASAGGG